MKNVVIAGATGLVGRACVDLLLAEPDVRAVHALVRCKTGRRHLKYLDHLVDWRKLENGRVVGKNGLDAALCCLGTTLRDAGSQAAFRQVDHDFVVAFAHFAKARGADTFVLVSAMGADPQSRVFYNRVKGDVESSVKALGFRSLTILRPSFLEGDRGDHKRVGEWLGIRAAKALGPLVPMRYRPVDARKVALAMLAAALSGSPGTTIVESDALQVQRV
jgi:uncharacterized protein YbjT (DUF2867 family)